MKKQEFESYERSEHNKVAQNEHLESYTDIIIILSYSFLHTFNNKTQSILR